PVFEDVPGRHRRDAPVPELGQAQGLFGLLAGADLAADPHHAQRRAVRAALHDLAALEEPLPVTLAVPDSVFGLVELVGPDQMGAEPGGDGRPIVGVHVLIPPGGVVVAFTGVEVRALTPVVVPTGEVS